MPNMLKPNFWGVIGVAIPTLYAILLLISNQHVFSRSEIPSSLQEMHGIIEKYTGWYYGSINGKDFYTVKLLQIAISLSTTLVTVNTTLAVSVLSTNRTYLADHWNLLSSAGSIFSLLMLWRKFKELKIAFTNNVSLGEKLFVNIICVFAVLFIFLDTFLTTLIFQTSRLIGSVCNSPVYTVCTLPEHYVYLYDAGPISNLILGELFVLLFIILPLVIPTEIDNILTTDRFLTYYVYFHAKQNGNIIDNNINNYMKNYKLSHDKSNVLSLDEHKEENENIRLVAVNRNHHPDSNP